MGTKCVVSSDPGQLPTYLPLSLIGNELLSRVLGKRSPKANARRRVTTSLSKRLRRLDSLEYAWKWKVKVKSLSGVRLLAISWTAAYKAPSSMGFSRPDNQNVITSYKSSFLFLSFTGSFKKFEYMFEVAHQKERQWSEAQIQLTSIFYC